MVILQPNKTFNISRLNTAINRREFNIPLAETQKNKVICKNQNIPDDFSKKSAYQNMQKLSNMIAWCEKIIFHMHRGFMMLRWLFGIRGKLNIKEYQVRNIIWNKGSGYDEKSILKAFYSSH